MKLDYWFYGETDVKVDHHKVESDCKLISYLPQ